MDDIERRLRDLGQRTAQEISRGPVPPADIVRRARLRKGYMALGSVGLAGLMAVGGYAGVNAFGDGSSVQTVSPDVLETAAHATQEQGSVRLEFESSSRSEGEISGNIQAQGSGEIDFEARRSHMKFESEGTSPGFGTVEMIMDGTTTYLKGATTGVGDKWLKTETGPSAARSMQSDQWSAEGIFEQLRSTSKSVEIVGQEELDGTWVTHYRAILGEEQAAGVFGNPETSEGIVGVAEVWIDDQALVRRMRNEYSINTSLMSGEMSMDMRFLDYGAQVDIEVPAPEDVIDAEEAVSESGGIEQAWISGEGKWHDPLLLVNLGLAERELCLWRRNEGVTGARIIKESTDEVFAAIDDMQEAAPAGDLGEDIVCFPDPPGDLTPLIEHPKRYTLRLTTPGGTTNVPLMSTHRMDAPD